MSCIAEQHAYFLTNWRMRHDRNPDWRRRHRHFARQAVSELRYLTNRPRKSVTEGRR